MVPFQNNSWMVIWKWKKRLKNVLLFFTSKQCTIQSNHKCNVFWQIRRQWFVFTTFSNCIATFFALRQHVMCDAWKMKLTSPRVFFTCISEVRVCQITGRRVFGVVLFCCFFVPCCTLRFPLKDEVRFVFTPICYVGVHFLHVYVICIYLRILVSKTIFIPDDVVV